MDVANRLPARRIPPGSARNRRPPAQRPAVEARIVDRTGGVRWIRGRAVAWIDQAVQVELVDGDGTFEVWLDAGDVRRLEPDDGDDSDV